jgi:hypothetical protein
MQVHHLVVELELERPGDHVVDLLLSLVAVPYPPFPPDFGGIPLRDRHLLRESGSPRKRICPRIFAANTSGYLFESHDRVIRSRPRSYIRAVDRPASSTAMACKRPTFMKFPAFA